MLQAYIRQMGELIEILFSHFEDQFSIDLLAQLNQIYNELQEMLELIEIDLGELLKQHA